MDEVLAKALLHKNHYAYQVENSCELAIHKVIGYTEKALTAKKLKVRLTTLHLHR